ncbi:MAG: hypothetical protein RL757_2040 [Bacteroidota bacterium]
MKKTNFLLLLGLLILGGCLKTKKKTCQIFSKEGFSKFSTINTFQLIFLCQILKKTPNERTIRINKINFQTLY